MTNFYQTHGVPLHHWSQDPGAQVIEVSEFMRQCRQDPAKFRQGSGHPARDDHAVIEVTLLAEDLARVPHDCTHVLWIDQ